MSQEISGQVRVKNQSKRNKLKLRMPWIAIQFNQLLFLPMKDEINTS